MSSLLRAHDVVKLTDFEVLKLVKETLDQWYEMEVTPDSYWEKNKTAMHSIIGQNLFKADPVLTEKQRKYTESFIFMYNERIYPEDRYYHAPERNYTTSKVWGDTNGYYEPSMGDYFDYF